MKTKRLFLWIVIVCMALSTTAKDLAKAKGYVIVTDYMKADGKKDISDILQKIIDENPHRTIYFPDGIYLISKPVLTPANPEHSVALQLSNYAIIRATENWNNTEAMIRLGGKDPANNITIPGSNYYLDGGIIDGRGVAKGISIDGGRETVVRNTSIKGVSLGLHIKRGANGGSSDCDIHDVNIVGNFKSDCIGVLVEGYDNTLTNMRIGGVHVGVQLRSAGNSLRNIHPLYYNAKEKFETSCGFLDESDNNWYDFCYSDQFAIGFYAKNGLGLFNNCFAYWYAAQGDRHTIFKTDKRFNARVMNMNVGMNAHNAVKENIILDASEDGGNGRFFNLYITDHKVITDLAHEKYMR